MGRPTTSPFQRCRGPRAAGHAPVPARRCWSWTGLMWSLRARCAAVHAPLPGHVRFWLCAGRRRSRSGRIRLTANPKRHGATVRPQPLPVYLPISRSPDAPGTATWIRLTAIIRPRYTTTEAHIQVTRLALHSASIAALLPAHAACRLTETAPTRGLHPDHKPMHSDSGEVRLDR